MRLGWYLALVLAFGAGCSSYRWSSAVPAELRTVRVPVFRNTTDLTELGPVAAREVAREFMREGTFRIAGEDAAVEVQGEIVELKIGHGNGDRTTDMRLHDCPMTAVAAVSVVNRRDGKVVMENRRFTARTVFVAGHDQLTGERDASGRLCEELARQVVDEVLELKW